MTPGEEIETWLHALEDILQRDVASGRFPDLASRRGIYGGIADDIRRKWPRLFVKCAGLEPSVDQEPK